MADIKLLQQIYSSVSPKGFELMIRDLLESIGFDDIEVTGRAGDSGIDLTATLRKSEIPGIDTSVSYIVQAKRYSPDSTLNPRFIRELRGSMQSGQRGILITTARVSTRTIDEEALKDHSRIILVIDGERLIELCKDSRIGVVEKYDIDEEYFSRVEVTDEEPDTEETRLVGKKMVTENDIRARILRIPKEVRELLSGKTSLRITLEDGTKHSLNIDKTGDYLGGVTEIYRKFGLMDDEGNPHEMYAEWQGTENGYLIRFSKIDSQERPNITELLQGIFKARFQRIPSTSVFVGNDLTLLCRYSKHYPKENVYWYGITLRDIDLIKERKVAKLAFFCSTKMVVFINSNDFLNQLRNLNTTDFKSGGIRHYHIFLKEIDSGSAVWILKGGLQIELTDIHLLNSQISA